MKSFNESVKINHNPNWSYIPDHLYRTLIIGGSGSGETNALLNLINQQPDIDKMYLCIRDPFELNYQLLISKREKAKLAIDDVSENLEVFDDKMTDMKSNKKNKSYSH